MNDFSLRLPAGMPKADRNAWNQENKNGINKKVSLYLDDKRTLHFPPSVSRETSYIVNDKSMTTNQRVVKIKEDKGLFGTAKQVVSISDGGGEPKKVITQEIRPLVRHKDVESTRIYPKQNWHSPIGEDTHYGLRTTDSDFMKTTTISSPTGAFPEHKSVQIKRGNGVYSYSCKVGEEVVGGYEAIPENRKFAEGFKGKIQKMAMAIGSDANGCERPVLRRVAALLLKII